MGDKYEVGTADLRTFLVRRTQEGVMNENDWVGGVLQFYLISEGNRSKGKCLERRFRYSLISRFQVISLLLMIEASIEYIQKG